MRQEGPLHSTLFCPLTLYLPDLMQIVLQSQVLSLFLLKILVMFLWGTHTPSGRQMESQSVEKKQTQINKYSLICML